MRQPHQCQHCLALLYCIVIRYLFLLSHNATSPGIPDQWSSIFYPPQCPRLLAKRKGISSVSRNPRMTGEFFGPNFVLFYSAKPTIRIESQIGKISYNKYRALKNCILFLPICIAYGVRACSTGCRAAVRGTHQTVGYAADKTRTLNIIRIIQIANQSIHPHYKLSQAVEQLWEGPIRPWAMLQIKQEH